MNKKKRIVIVANTSEKSFKRFSKTLQGSVEPSQLTVLCISTKKEKNISSIEGPPKDFVAFDSTVPPATAKSYMDSCEKLNPVPSFLSIGFAVERARHMTDWSSALLLIN